MLKRIVGWAVGIVELLTPWRYKVKAYQERVSDDLWRGSRLTEPQMIDLFRRGFRTIVDLCAEHTADDHAKIPYMHFVHIPIVDSRPPTPDQARQFLNLFYRRDRLPVFVHCEAGAGRTGVMVALYRIHVQKWTVEDALADGARRGLNLPDQIKFVKEFTR